MITTLVKKSALHQLRAAKLYCITMPQGSEAGYFRMVDDACRGGADVIQLREKNMSNKDLLRLAKDLKAVCEPHGALFIVNDRVDIALAADADGVHLGQDDLPLLEARKIVRSYLRGMERDKEDFVIGCSTHSLEQALKAQKDGADYVGCGPVFATPTKPSYGAVGLELVRQYKQNVSIPFVAIGGIDENNIDKVLEAGAACAAVVRAAFADGSAVESSVRALKTHFRGDKP